MFQGPPRPPPCGGRGAIRAARCWRGTHRLRLAESRARWQAACWEGQGPGARVASARLREARATDSRTQYDRGSRERAAHRREAGRRALLNLGTTVQRSRPGKAVPARRAGCGCYCKPRAGRNEGTVTTHRVAQHVKCARHCHRSLLSSRRLTHGVSSVSRRHSVSSMLIAVDTLIARRVTRRRRPHHRPRPRRLRH